MYLMINGELFVASEFEDVFEKAAIGLSCDSPGSIRLLEASSSSASNSAERVLTFLWEHRRREIVEPLRTRPQLNSSKYHNINMT